MANTISLTLVNDSNDVNDSQVLVFQTNVATNLNEVPVAWRVFTGLGRGWSRTFEYPLDLQIAVVDSYGNRSPLMDAQPGQLWHVYYDRTGDELGLVSPAPGTTTEIQIANDLAQGSIDACIYRAGKLLATKTNVAPGQKATFQFNPSIYIGVVSQYDVREGAPIDSAILTSVNQQLSLVGVTSGTIQMTGGGGGVASSAFKFTLNPT